LTTKLQVARSLQGYYGATRIDVAGTISQEQNLHSREEAIVANNDEPDGPPSEPRETLGNAPHPPVESIGHAPGDGGTGPAPKEATGGTPVPAPPPKQTTGGTPTAAGSRNVPLLIGIGIVIVAIIAVIIGIAH
jgi:hypothetical protein